MDTLKTTLKTLPHSPGVYLYKDAAGTTIYVGKARDLSSRVRQYFNSPRQQPEKIKQLVAAIHSIHIKPVATEFEALLLEAKLIRMYTPKYNSIAKDDKSPVYIHIDSSGTRLPIVKLSRKPKTPTPSEKKEYFGPFSSQKIARDILRRIRRSIPFCQQRILNGKPCFYTHLGLCDPCPSKIAGLPDGQEKTHAVRQYKKNILQLKLVLSGQSTKLIRAMKKDMDLLAKQEQFEQAAKIYHQINTLVSTINNSYDPFMFEEIDSIQKAPLEQITRLQQTLIPFFPNLPPLKRIECYDISTINGSASVGSMVVFEDGIPNTSQYKKFSIKKQGKLSDTAMMEEVLGRRLQHPEWSMPDIIVVDGGKPQVNCAATILEKQSISIPIIGLAKRFETIIIKQGQSYKAIRLALADPGLQLLQHIRDEAHRFAISFHKKKREQLFSFTGQI